MRLVNNTTTMVACPRSSWTNCRCSSVRARAWRRWPEVVETDGVAIFVCEEGHKLALDGCADEEVLAAS